MALSAEQEGKVQALKEALGPEVDAMLKKGGEEGLTHSTLARWLTARKWVLKDAQQDLAAHASWRVAYVPHGRITEEEIGEQEFNHRKAFFTGYDRQGHPLTLVVVRNHKMDNAEASKRHIAYAFDCGALLGARIPGWDGKFTGLFDLRGVGASNCDFTTLRHVFDLLQNHYPERLHKLYLYESPLIFYGLFKMVAPFIDPVTRKKVKFVYAKDGDEELRAAIDPKYLPPEFKGTGHWHSVREVYRALLGLDPSAHAPPPPADLVGGPAQEDVAEGEEALAPGPVPEAERGSLEHQPEEVQRQVAAELEELQRLGVGTEGGGDGDGGSGGGGSGGAVARAAHGVAA